MLTKQIPSLVYLTKNGELSIFKEKKRLTLKLDNISVFSAVIPFVF